MDVYEVQRHPLPDRRIAAVGGDDVVAHDFALIVPHRVAHPRHAVVASDQVVHPCTTHEREGRAGSRVLDQHLEHRRLRDPPRPATSQVEPEQRPRVAVKLDGVEQTVRQGVERVAQPHLPERIDTAGLEPLPAKLPREVGLAFEQRDLDVAARQ